MLLRSPVLCVGAAHWDLIGRTSAALARGVDAPGRIQRRPGGVALNVACALAELECPAVLVAAIGRDAAGLDLQGAIWAAGVDTIGLCRQDGPTDSYIAVEDADGELHVAVADCGGLERAGADLLAPLRDGRVTRRGRPWDAPVAVDGNLAPEVLAELLEVDVGEMAPVAIVAASPCKTARIAPVLRNRPATLYLNRREAEAICGTGFADSRAAAEALIDLGLPEVVVTDGAGPATAATGLELLSLSPPAVVTGSLTGAGDGFVAAHLVARGDGLDAGAALAAALAAAARRIAQRPT